MSQERDVGARVLAREVCLGANDQVGSLEMRKCRHHLSSVEGRVQRDEDSPEFEQSICCLDW